MLDETERRYLLNLAYACHQKGLSAPETRRVMRDSIGAITNDNRLRCAVRHVFGDG
ncbi:hypothetical protein [uncultured Tateyamaria sp.]|uniref:hypothetical protein n=1 Tax=uncultured Tateyamaria sp. TaxID=455651 RepID=UPI002615CE05|nr:hypothetical protein [uncultured Tateyamaria sp.]